MPLQKETNFHLPSIDCGSCRDMEKPIPPFPFIGPIKNSSCPKGEGILSMSLRHADCVLFFFPWGRICITQAADCKTSKGKSRIKFENFFCSYSLAAVDTIILLLIHHEKYTNCRFLLRSLQLRLETSGKNTPLRPPAFVFGCIWCHLLQKGWVFTPWRN